MNTLQKKNKNIKKYFIIISNKKLRNDLKSNSLKIIHFDTTYKLYYLLQ